MAPTVSRVKLGSQGLEVSKQGLGCMGMSMAYGAAKPDKDMIELIHHAIDLGITFFDTSDVYGPHTNEVLVGKALKGFREKVQIATKFGIAYKPAAEEGKFELGVIGTPEYVQSSAEASLKRLDIDCIDLYYFHRLDKDVPIEVTVGAMKKLVDQGKVKYLGLSEASGSEIRRAHAVHPITAVQIEWSLWTRDIEEDVVPTCKELGIGIVPYSPLGRGFFSGVTMAEYGENDFRNVVPRTSGENYEKNRKFYEKLVVIGKKHKRTPGQLALAWVQHQGEDVVPIPGTTKIKNLEENVGALDIVLSKEEIEEIEAAVPIADIAGNRYQDAMMEHTWRNATTIPLSSWKGST